MSTRTPHAFRVRSILFSILCATAPAAATAVEKGSQQVSQFYGSFSYGLPIEVPPFHGIEPKLSLSYSSEGRNGIFGVGWSLSGFSTIERANSGRGTPRFNSSDIYLLDGQELVACVGGSASPSCTSGGTHSTKIESYLKIKLESNNTWTVWGKDGTRTIFSPIINVTGGTFRWGQTSVVDTKSNTVTYTWACVDGDCYPSQVDYQNSYRISFALETRDDQQSAAAYSQLTTMKYRIRSIFVSLWGTGFIRAYKLSYGYSSLTGRSLLTSVRQYGKNVQSTNGLITDGDAFPEQTFAYQNDSAAANGKTFVGEAPNPPTSGTEDVVWANRINAYAVSPGNSLQKSIGGNAWDAGASSTRAIASGNGYAEVAVSTAARYMVGLSNGDIDANPWDIDFAAYNYYGTLYAYEAGYLYGPFGTAPAGATLRVQVDNNVVTYRSNGSVYYTSTRVPTYPLRVDTSLYDAWSTITGVRISGLLQDANYWCQGALLLTGDFDSDGRTDQLCYRSETQNTQVALATATGSLPPTTWLTQYAFVKPVVGDFNGSGLSHSLLKFVL